MIKVYLPEIGSRLKQLRKQKNLSQTALADQLGVSKSVLSSYETGVHFPPYDVLLRLSRIFGVTTDYLLGVPEGRVISVEGLTAHQIEAVRSIVSELRELNKE